MYKIFVNDRPVFLQKGKQKHVERSWRTQNPAILYRRRSDIKRALWLMEDHFTFDSLTIYGSDLAVVKQQFFNLFRIIEASGGLVRNQLGEVLMIFRRGVWDLPKGKIDFGEKKRAAALREVEEETGVSGLEIIQKLTTTYHLYTYKKRQVLKVTYWYEMYTEDESKLVPQADEDIEKAVWVKPKKLASKLADTYPNIIEVFECADLVATKPSVNGIQQDQSKIRD